MQHPLRGYRLTTSGKAYCWGSNSSGQLGNEGLIDRTTPEPVLGEQFASLSAGADHTCGVATDNTVACWGHNGYGELGDGTTLNRWQPALVHGLVPGKRVELSTGSFYTCAVTDGYAAYCWGSNIEGQLGDGTTTDRSMPVRVVPPV